MAQHFLPPPPTRKEEYALARNGNPLQIEATNLQWAVNPVAPWKVPPTPKVLTDEQAAKILPLHRQGQSLRQLAKAFGVGASTIGRVIKRGEDRQTQS